MVNQAAEIGANLMIKYPIYRAELGCFSHTSIPMYTKGSQMKNI